MRRRDLLLGATAMMTVAHSVRAQQRAVPVIGYLSSTSPGPSAPWAEAFRQGLRENGYDERENVMIEYRWAEFQYDRLPALAAELVGHNVDVIIACGNLGAVLAAKSATSTIPIVFPAISDPVGSGLVASLARPGGNVTGFSPFQFELTPKRFELLTDRFRRPR